MRHSYIEYEALIKNKAFYYSQVYNFNYDDLLSEAQEIFCIASRNYRRRGHTFKAWLNFMLNKRLNSFVIKATNNEIISSDLVTIILGNRKHTENVIESIWIDNKIDELEWKTKRIIYLILYPTRKQIMKSPRKLSRHNLKNYLIEQGWDDKIIRICFREIEEAFEL